MDEFLSSFVAFVYHYCLAVFIKYLKKIEIVFAHGIFQNNVYSVYTTGFGEFLVKRSEFLRCCFFVFFMFSNKDVIVDKKSNNLDFLLSFSVTAAQHKQNAKRKAWLEMLH